MRLWHYKLIPYLPNHQLVSQWRELSSIFSAQNKYILINYVYDHPREYLKHYTKLFWTSLIREVIKLEILITTINSLRVLRIKKLIFRNMIIDISDKISIISKKSLIESRKVLIKIRMKNSSFYF